MPRSCSICLHPQFLAIDQALAAKEPYRTIAERFGTSPAALHRHQAHAHPHADVVPMVTTPPAAPRPEASALIAAARRVDAAARHVHQQTRELRSLHDPVMLTRLEDLARVLVEVTALLVELSTVAPPTA